MPLFRGEWGKHFELKKKQLLLFKQERRTGDAIKVLDWLSSSEAAQNYKLTSEQSIEYVKHQVTLLEPFESTKITQEVDSARTRLNAEPVVIIRERAEVKSFESSRLNEFYRRIGGSSGKLFDRLLKMVLSDYLSAEVDRSILAAELLALPEAEAVKKVLAEDVNCAVAGSPQSLLNEAKSDFAIERFEQLLKREHDFSESLRKWKRAFNSAAFTSTQLEWARLKFLSTVKLGWFEDAYLLIPSFASEELLSDALFESVLLVFEQTRHLSEAVKLIEEQLMHIDPETPVLILRLIDLLIKLSQFDEANEYIAAVKEAFNLNSDLPSQARLYFASGMVAWLQGRRTPEDCLNEFLKALKADSSSGLYFFWVGKYYWRIEKQSSAAKALKCVTKSLSLDPSNLLAALLLAEIILQLPELTVEGLNLTELLQPFVGAHSRNRRLMYYLGAAHFSLYSQYIEAATALQSALKAPSSSPDDDNSDPQITDAHCLTFLAESFLRAGRFASAEKAFLRLRQEAPGPVSATGLASVYSRSEHFIQAVDVFDSLAASDFSELVREKLLVDTLESKLLLAKYYLGQALFKAATGQLQACLNLPVVMQPVFWRLKSELFLLLDEYKECINCTSSDSFDGEKFNLGLAELVQLASKFNSKLISKATLCALLSLSLSCANEAAELSLNWLQVAHCLVRAESFDFAQAVALNALKCTKSVEIAAKAHHFLFSIAYYQHNFRKAQHHLVRSLHLQESLPVWLDLGRFYARQGDLELAREAFKRALALDPECNETAIELASLDSDATSSASVLALAQRDFSFQPARFDVKSALIVASAQEDSECKQFARFLLHLRFPQTKSFQPDDYTHLPLNVPELWKLVQEEPSNLVAWQTLCKRDGFDCEYLLTRPLNDLAQAGWRGLLDPLAASQERHRTLLEEQSVKAKLDLEK